MYVIQHPGVSCRTTAEALGVRKTKATQARQHAFDKIARLLMADPVGTVVMLAEAMVRIEQELIREKLAERPQQPPGAASLRKKYLPRRVSPMEESR